MDIHFSRLYVSDCQSRPPKLHFKFLTFLCLASIFIPTEPTAQCPRLVYAFVEFMGMSRFVTIKASACANNLIRVLSCLLSKPTQLRSQVPDHGPLIPFSTCVYCRYRQLRAAPSPLANSSQPATAVTPDTAASSCIALA